MPLVLPGIRGVRLIPIASLAVMAGCQGLNLSPQPGPHVQLDTLRPTADFYARVDKPVPQSGASLAGISRENWTPTSFSVPVSGVEHKPTYTTDGIPGRTTSQARQRGEYPAQATAVQGSDWDSTSDQAVEAALGPVRAAWDIIWMVPKMVETPPDTTVSSPRAGYERAPHNRTATNGGLRDGGLGVKLLPLSAVEGAPPAPTTPAVEPATATQPPAPPLDPSSPAPSPAPAPSPVAPPAPQPSQSPNAEPAPVQPPAGIPPSAFGGSDSPRRKENKEKKEKDEKGKP